MAMQILPTILFKQGAVEMIDQTLLPQEYKILRITDLETLCEAIQSLRVRGAPAIGVAAAMGVANILCLTGDGVQAGDQPQAKPVFDKGFLA